ncbi:MAG TPA: hypothetical protein VMX76_01590 [Nevskiaceae bacterium]|nr:hypothetical protein [Nevskiaceae bacterium]
MFNKITITKRQKFVASTLILSTGLLIVQLANISWRYQAIAILVLLTYFLSGWSLREGLSGIEWLTVLILPVLFTAGIGLFYFLIPARWLTRLPVIALYGLGFYALMLIENIFSVAAIRTIQLLRSAQTVGFLLTLMTSFFLFDTVLSYRFGPWLNFFLVFLASFPLVLQGLWYINLEEKISKKIWLYTTVLSLVLAEFGLAFSFWPVNVAVGSLALTTVAYLTLGLTQHKLGERLFPKTIREYLISGILVLLIIFLTTRWGG